MKPFQDVVLSEEFTREVRAALRPEPDEIGGILCLGGFVYEITPEQLAALDASGAWFNSKPKKPGPKSDTEIANDALKDLGQPPSVPKLGEF